MRKEKSQSVLKMMKEFPKEYERGMSVIEVADKYGVGRSTIYHYLGDIAEANNVPRDYYIRHQKGYTAPETFQSKESYQKYSPEDARVILQNMDNIITELEMIKQSLDKTIEDANTFLKNYMEGKAYE